MRALATILALLIAAPASAAIAHVQSSPSNATGSGTSIVLTFGSGITQGNVIWVTSRNTGEARTVTPSMTGVTFTTVVGPTDHSGAASIQMYLWCGQVDTGSATQLTLTISSADVFSGVAAEFSGTGTCASDVDQSGSGQTSSAGTAHDISAGLTTVVADELLIGACGFSNLSGAMTAGASYTGFDTNDSDSRPFAQYRIVSATGTYSTPMTSTNSVDSVCVMGTHEIASAGGATATRGLLLGVGP